MFRRIVPAMGPLAALLIATPVFGFQLTLEPAFMPDVSNSAVHTASARVEVGAATESASPAQGSIAEQMQTRARLTPLHKWMGIATWASMSATVVLGWLQYNNLYGFFSSREDTPCVNSGTRPAFGQRACVDTPWPHLASSILTTALYTSTFALSLRLPDPVGLDQGNGEYARNLRRHKRLRWVHFAGMIAQNLLGIVIANSESFGLNRTEDFGTLQALSTVHLAIGLATYATLTWSGLIFLLN